MSMFDYITCHYPLPGIKPAYLKKNTYFQTKDLASVMETYLITEDGRLFFKKILYEGFDDIYIPNSNESNTEKEIDLKRDFLKDFVGEIEFYTSNIFSSGPGYYTQNGEDVEIVSYSAKFVDGVLKDIKQTEYEIHPALPSDPHRFEYRAPTEEENEIYNKRIEESLLGKTIFVLRGSLDPNYLGYYGEVVAETSKTICVRYKDDLNLLEKSGRDFLFWDSEEDALNDKIKRDEKWNKQQQEYDLYAKEWKEKRKVL